MIIIKQAKSEDISGIVEIDRQAFGNQGISEETIGSQIKIFSEGIFVAKENDKIVGVICYEKHKEKKFSPCNHNVHETHSKEGALFYLSVITVAEISRNKNIGSLLLKKVLELGKKSGIRKIYLPVNKKHPYLEKGVLHFWQKNGYKIVGETDWEILQGKVVSSHVLEKLIL